MQCPVCGGNYSDGALFCTECGANLSAFKNVPADKIINNQTPEQQQKLGDDGVTQLIPENYATAKGDDEVTQLIPENYTTATGDDTKTVLLPEGGMPQQPNMSNPHGMGMNQPQMGFAPQGMSGQQQSFMPQGMNRPQQGFAPQGMNYNNMQTMPRQAAVPVNTGMMKLFSAFVAVSAVITAVFTAIFLGNPVYYIFEHYVGGHHEFQEAWEDGTLISKSAETEFITTCGPYCVASIIMLAMCVVLAIVCIFKTKDKMTGKPAMMFSVFTAVSGLIGSGIMAFFQFFFGMGFKYGLEQDSNSDELKELIADNKVFNYYDLITIFIIVTAVLAIVNVVIAAVAEKKWSKSNNPQYRR